MTGALLEPAEWAAVRLSLEGAARSVSVSLVPAVLVAVLLSRGRFPGRALLDAVVHLPLVVPPVVVGWGLLMLFGVRGPLGALLDDWFGVRLVFTTEGAALATAVRREAARRGLDAYGMDPTGAAALSRALSGTDPATVTELDESAMIALLEPRAGHD